MAQDVAFNLLSKNERNRSSTEANNHTTFQVKDILFDNISTAEEEHEGVHIRLERYHYGIHVIGGDLVVHLSSDLLVVGISPSTLISISITNSSIAMALQQQQYVTTSNMTNTTADTSSKHELVIYSRRSRLSAPTLAWDITKSLIAKDGTAMIVHWIMNVDSGEAIDQFSETKTLLSAGWPTFIDIPSIDEGVIPADKLKEDVCFLHEAAIGIGNTMYNGKVKLSTSFTDGLYYQLKDPLRQCHTTTNDHSSLLGTSTDSTTKDLETSLDYNLYNIWGWSDNYTAASDVHYGYAASFDYFQNMFGRQGIYNTNNSEVVVHSQTAWGFQWNNAYWYNGTMTYGIGDGTIFNPFTSLEIVAHVFTHGVTEATANLIYSGESGGLSEATSDIFAILIDFHTKDRPFYAPNYFIGENVFRNQPGSFFRSMMQPSDDAFLYGGLQSSFDCYCKEKLSIGDVTDIHYFSSGIANHFFYLLAEGTVQGTPSRTCHPWDCQVATRTTQTLVGIGQEKAGWIWYRAVTIYFTSDTNFAEARVATLKAAKDLYTDVEVKAAKEAWSAVKVLPSSSTSMPTPYSTLTRMNHSSSNLSPSPTSGINARVVKKRGRQTS